jgi:hypothetical protein
MSDGLTLETHKHFSRQVPLMTCIYSRQLRPGREGVGQ